VAGRKKKSLLDVMRTRLWLSEMLRVTGMDNLNQLGELLDDVDIKKMLYRYASGDNGVSRKMLADIDARVSKHDPDFDGGSSFFLIGPASAKAPQGFAPLWYALDDSIEQVWEAMLAYDPDLAVQKFLGVPFSLRCTYLTVQIFGTAAPPPYWQEQPSDNQVAKAYAHGTLQVDIDLITFAIAAWRMAHFVGEAQPMLDYILIGLLDRAIPELLEEKYGIDIESDNGKKRHTITDDLLEHLEALDQQNLNEAEEAIKDMDYTANIYPAEADAHPVQVGQANYQQPFDSRYLFNRLKRNSVSAFLAKKNEQRHGV
jgi:hypothetical protein